MSAGLCLYHTTAPCPRSTELHEFEARAFGLPAHFRPPCVCYEPRGHAEPHRCAYCSHRPIQPTDRAGPLVEECPP